MSSETLALLLLFLIHAIGLGVLFFALLRSADDNRGWRDWWPRDDDGGSEPPDNPSPPFDGAEQSPVRLREPGRIADAHPRPARRPEHPPQRVPQRERV